MSTEITIIDDTDPNEPSRVVLLQHKSTATTEILPELKPTILDLMYIKIQEDLKNKDFNTPILCDGKSYTVYLTLSVVESAKPL